MTDIFGASKISVNKTDKNPFSAVLCAGVGVVIRICSENSIKSELLPRSRH